MASDEQAHWLLRLDARAWRSAAAVEFAAGEARVDARRAAITHARRAAGMAMNAVLVAFSPTLGLAAAETRWGRSYIDHLRAIAGDGALCEPLPPRASTEAAALLAIPTVAGGERLITLGARPHAAATAALAHARALVQLCDEALASIAEGRP